MGVEEDYDIVDKWPVDPIGDLHPLLGSTVWLLQTKNCNSDGSRVFKVRILTLVGDNLFLDLHEGYAPLVLAQRVRQLRKGNSKVMLWEKKEEARK